MSAKIRYQKIEQDPSYPPYINSCIGQIQLFFKKNNVEPEKSFRSVKQVTEEYFSAQKASGPPGETQFWLFGVEICSRYSDLYELQEMLSLVIRLKLAGLESCVKSMFYDSKCSACFIESSGKAGPRDHEILLLIEDCVSQFWWRDNLGHSNEFTDPPPDYEDEDTPW